MGRRYEPAKVASAPRLSDYTRQASTHLAGLLVGGGGCYAARHSLVGGLRVGVCGNRANHRVVRHLA